MRQLKEILEGAGHIKNRLGSGSSGVVYKIGNDKVRKTFRIESKYNTIAKEKSIIERWSHVKKGLKVIPYIYDVNNEGYTMDMFESPCEEGKLIEKVIWKCLFSPNRRNWTQTQIQKAENLVGKENAEFVMRWLDDYCDDVELIMGARDINDDIRSSNIGKTKDGKIVIFDWIDTH